MWIHPKEVVEEEYEEVAVSDEEEYYIEEIVEDETIEDEEEFVDDCVVHNDDDDDDESGDYVDDDSSAPPPSFSSDFQVFEESDTGLNFHESFQSIDVLREKQFERQNAAVSEGARKAIEEARAREQYLHRQTAREALQRKRLQQEALKRGVDDAYAVDKEKHPSKQDEHDGAAQRILMEEIQRVDKVLLQRHHHVPPRTHILGAAELEKRNRALMQLRRQTARDQLTRNNTQIKATKIREQSICGVHDSRNRDSTR